MPRPTLFATLFAFMPAIAFANASLTIAFDMDDVITARYDCGGNMPLAVVYVASDTDALALVPVEGGPRVFAQVVSGSGARYVSGPYEWIIKGEAGQLIDTLEDRTVFDCGPAEQ
ncbi:MliC family protein [Paracoccus subflavus]|nr:MliC family protein [Paracoccus subflavus]